VIESGGYFGEMSLLTGEPRSATVLARGEVTLLEVKADTFREVGEISPQAIEQVALVAVARRADLMQAKSAGVSAAVADVPATILARMRKFLRLR
jgi:CRP-like cAMP-binding protein